MVTRIRVALAMGLAAVISTAAVAATAGHSQQTGSGPMGEPMLSFYPYNGMGTFYLGEVVYQIAYRMGGEVEPEVGLAGMRDPILRAGWSTSGFVGMAINGIPVAQKPPAEVRTLQTRPRGVLEYVWDHPSAEVCVRWTGTPGTDYLTAEISIRPHEEIRSIVVRTRCCPSVMSGWSGYFTDTRKVKTADVEIGAGQDRALSPSQNWWLLYCDEVFDVARGMPFNPSDDSQNVLNERPDMRGEAHGPCGLAFDPAAVETIHVGPIGGSVDTTLTCRPTVRRVRLAFWEFPMHGNSEALAKLRHEAESVRKHWDADTMPEPRWVASSTNKILSIEVDHALSRQLVTPHTEWARPYARGPVKVLTVEGYSSNTRVAIELMERFDLDVTPVYWDGTGDRPLVGMSLGYERLERLLAEPIDCFTMPPFFLIKGGYEANGMVNHTLRDQDIDAVVERVRSGAGLVTVGSLPASLSEAEPLGKLPAFLAVGTPLGQVDCYTLGKGRIVVQKDYINLGNDLDMQVDREYMLQLLGKTILWASGREPRVSIEQLTVAPTPVVRTGSAAGTISVALDKGSSTTSLEGSVSIRRDDGWQTTVVRAAAFDRSGALRVALPVLAAGKYYADVIVTRAGKTETFGSTAFTVTANQLVAALTLDREWGELGEHIQGTVELSAPLVGKQTVRVSLFDFDGRELLRKELGGQALGFDIPTADWMPMVVRVQAAIVQDGHEVSCAHAWYNIPRSYRDRFNLIVWSYWGMWDTADYAARVLREAGATTVLPQATPHYAAGAGLTNVVSSWICWRKALDENGVMKPFCWNSPEAEAEIGRVVEKYEEFRQRGVLAYSVSDEMDIYGACYHPACVEAYRRHLAEAYGSVEALNASWGTGFKSLADVSRAEAQDTSTPPRAFDRRAFEWYNVQSAYQRLFGAGFGRNDPGAISGYEGVQLQLSQRPDLDTVCRTQKFLLTYISAGDEVVRSIAPPDAILGNWIGYSKSSEQLIYYYWRSFTRFPSAVGFFMHMIAGTWRGMLAPGFNLHPETRKLIDEIRITTDGLGDLLMRMKRQDDGIAVLYSFPDGPDPHKESFGGYEADNIMLQHCLWEMGLQFSYVTDAMLRRGEFDGAKYKVLILPQAYALGAKEAGVIREFVREGGTVIADVGVGRFDNHNKAQSPILDDLFGIKQGESEPARIAKAVIGSVSLPRVHADPSVTAAGAASRGVAGEVPVVFAKKLGAGQAIFLNFPWQDIPFMGDPRVSPDTESFVHDLLMQAGVRPTITAEGPDGRRLRRTEIIRWQSGTCTVVCLFRRADDAEEAIVFLERKFHVYDLRNREYLGYTDTFKAAALPNRATFYALLPTAAGGPLISSPRSVHRGTRWQARITVPGARDTRVLHVHIRLPDGRELLPPMRNLILGRGETQTIAVPIAYNDPVGTWTVAVTDVLTGKATPRSFVVIEDGLSASS